MQPESKEYLDSRGIKHSDFRPQPLSSSLLKKQDLIITMADHHKEHIVRNYSNIHDIESKTVTLKEFNVVNEDIIKILMSKIKRVAFICYANICRSPAAEKLAEFYAEKNGLKGVSFESAGWHTAFPTAVEETRDYLEAKGIDMSQFKSRRITRDLIENSDLVIGMESYHLLKVKKKYRDLKESLEGKLFTLLEFNGVEKKEANIPDPYKKPLEEYNRIMRVIEENIEKLIKKVIKLNKSS